MSKPSFVLHETAHRTLPSPLPQTVDADLGAPATLWHDPSVNYRAGQVRQTFRPPPSVSRVVPSFGRLRRDAAGGRVGLPSAGLR